VKQSVHAIQLALERYAVDHGGAYPSHLYGGDSLLNIGTVNFHNPGSFREGAACWERPLHLPYDRFYIDGAGRDYHSFSWEELAAEASITSGVGNLVGTLGDPLQTGGYLVNYPSNPFASKGARRRFSVDALGDPGACAYACYGGYEGKLMFNLGPFGELPQLMLDADGSPDLRLDFPGSFYYHPRWKDGITNAGHLRAAKVGSPGSWIPADVGPEFVAMLDDSADAVNTEVGGYDLLAFGSVRTKGLPLDNSVSVKGTPHLFRSGYLTLGQERNPWVGPNAPEGDYGGSITDFDERPYSDSVPDFYIMQLGSGLDKKVLDVSMDATEAREAAEDVTGPQASRLPFDS